MLVLRQSTSIDIRMGPFVDATDGVTPETGITLGAADQAEVLKENGAATVAMGGTFAAVTGCDGWYDYTVATGDVDTVGEVVFVVQDSSECLPVFVRAMVVEEAVYDAIYDSTADAHTAAISDIESSLVIVKSDLVIATSDTAAIHSQTTRVESDLDVLNPTTAIQTASDVVSYMDANSVALSDIESSLVIIKSDLVVATSDTAAIEAAGGSLTTAQNSKLTQIHSDAIVIGSDTAAIEAAGGSLTTAQDSKLTRIQSDLVIVGSDLVVAASDAAAVEAWGDPSTPLSDIESSLVIIKSDLVVATSDSAAIESELIVVHSETTDLQSGVNVSEINGATITGDGSATPFDVA